MLFGWEGNRRSDHVSYTLWYRINGLRKGLERQAYAFIAVMHSLLLFASISLIIYTCVPIEARPKFTTETY